LAQCVLSPLLASWFGQKRPTKRAADGGESARFTSIFLALTFFYISSLFPARPRPPLTQTVGTPLAKACKGNP